MALSSPKGRKHWGKGPRGPRGPESLYWYLLASKFSVKESTYKT